ncbi:MAG: Flp family type IVb pilin [Alphaproteobacteria bacterium]|nr:MAG: Flp family type IVb pilin [Alphaproteobacteria bacterium]
MLKLIAQSYVQFKTNEEGATAIEYGLIAAGIAVAISAAVFAFGGELTTLFEDLGGSLEAPE